MVDSKGADANERQKTYRSIAEATANMAQVLEQGTLRESLTMAAHALYIMAAHLDALAQTKPTGYNDTEAPDADKPTGGP